MKPAETPAPGTRITISLGPKRYAITVKAEELKPKPAEVITLPPPPAPREP